MYLAAVPLMSSKMPLVRCQLVTGTTEANLIELLGSNTVERVSVSVGPFDVSYGFLDCVREELLRAGCRSDMAQVLLTVVERLGPRDERVTRLHEVALSPSGAHVPDLPASLELIVRPTIFALEAMAGPYSAPARSLRIAVHRKIPATRPPLNRKVTCRSSTAMSSRNRNLTPLLGVIIAMNTVRPALPSSAPQIRHPVFFKNHSSISKRLVRIQARSSQ
ncbi:hypothetical protein [Streptosporangium sp. NPDC023615]|uniref:hypothetical protein n=1 Tax=Streptosporangium sp. NPDC023615 TaxID=3154794 RepID=UPI00341C98C5